MTTHIMLDLETWGTEPGNDIRSIGACVFDPLTGFVAERGSPATFYTNTMGGKAYGLARSRATEQWWRDQSSEAKAAFKNGTTWNLYHALVMFSEWLHTVAPAGFRLWSHGPSFDEIILRTVYHRVGVDVPWHYRSPRDTRTAFDVAGIDDHSTFLSQFNTGTHHNALDDALAQAKAVCAAYAMVRAGQRPRPLPHDVATHRAAWRNAIVGMIETTEHPDDNTGYWSHELTAFDRTFNALLADQR